MGLALDRTGIQCDWYKIGSGQNHLARSSERGKKTMQTKKEVVRQHQGMERPEVRQVPEVQTTPVVKG